MKIVHVAPSAPFNDGWSYQENLLPKYQKKLGHEVILIVTNQTNGDEIDLREEFISEDGFKVIRRKVKKAKIPRLQSALSYIDVYDLLCQIQPDFIFYHGLVSTTIFQVTKYIKKCNPSCVLVQDNHLDSNNIGYSLDRFKYKMLNEIYKYIFHKNEKYVSKVYGVTPWRKQYAELFFGVPKEKTDVLIMGSDDEQLNFEKKSLIRKQIRDKYMIKDTDFLIVTGGKIDEKKKIHYLMDAVSRIENVKLIIFGSVDKQMEKLFNSKLSAKIIYIGWISSRKIYDYFFAADLAFFPGQHSVLWEQACASKIPCVFAQWPGMDHVNNGGNSYFVSEINSEGIEKTIRELKFTQKYYNMLSVAESSNTDIYLYSNIARKSLECAQHE